ncbi:MAG TPA: phytoene/squalene synthase family protein [Longimicrobiaceae bacterium]|nr:phytoene/squalene synthase family protein [Longimicrobiaceae bacterium]
MTPPVLEASRASLARNARTFSLAARLLPAGVRDDAALVYAFCREVDDTADEATDTAEAAVALARLRAEAAGHAPARPLVAEFRAAAARLGLPLRSATELVDGVASDLGPVRMADDAELLRYCYRVASTVGLMMCAVLGVRCREAHPHAVDLGIAMQLTNICRDVAEDARRGRVYLPADRLRRAGVDPASLAAGAADRCAVAAVVAEVLALADRYYASADGGMRDIPPRVRPAILVASRVYRAIGVRLRQRGCDALAGRTVVPAPEKALWGTRALAACLRPAILGIGPRWTHDGRLHAALRGLPGVNA